MQRNQIYDACVDIGGTKLAVSLVKSNEHTNGQTARTTPLLAKRTEPTVKTGTHDALPLQIIRMLDAACCELNITRQQIQRVGVSSCGPFLNVDGHIEIITSNLCGGKSGFVNNDWLSIPLERILRSVFINVRIENDAVSALLAEVQWGALQGAKNAAYVTWSTGVGTGLMVDGHVLRGKNGNAGHAGHMIVADALSHIHQQPLVCGCGTVGDLQSQIAGCAIPKRFGIAGADLMQAARSDDVTVKAHALAHVDSLCEGMARGLYNLTVTLDLDRIAMGGSVFWHNQDLLLPRVRAGVMGRFPTMTEGLAIVPAGLGLDVTNYGALALLS